MLRPERSLTAAKRRFTLPQAAVFPARLTNSVRRNAVKDEHAQLLGACGRDGRHLPRGLTPHEYGECHCLRMSGNIRDSPVSQIQCFPLRKRFRTQRLNWQKTHTSHCLWPWKHLLRLHFEPMRSSYAVSVENIRRRVWWGCLEKKSFIS